MLNLLLLFSYISAVFASVPSNYLAIKNNPNHNIRKIKFTYHALKNMDTVDLRLAFYEIGSLKWTLGTRSHIKIKVIAY